LNRRISGAIIKIAPYAKIPSRWSHEWGCSTAQKGGVVRDHNLVSALDVHTYLQWRKRKKIESCRKKERGMMTIGEYLWSHRSTLWGKERGN